MNTETTLSPSVRQPSLYPLLFITTIFCWGFGCALNDAMLILAGTLSFAVGIVFVLLMEEV